MADNPTQRVGQLIKRYRQQRGLTLRALAERSGVSAAMISEAERGTKSPTITVLSAIAKALGTPLSHLVEDQRERPSIIYSKARERQVLVDPNGVQREHLGPIVRGSNVEFVRTTFPGGGTTGMFAPRPRGTVERLYLEQGVLEVQFQDEVVRMEAGDTLVSAGDRARSYHNPGKHAATIFLVIDPGSGAP